MLICRSINEYQRSPGLGELICESTTNYTTLWSAFKLGTLGNLGTRCESWLERGSLEFFFGGFLQSMMASLRLTLRPSSLPPIPYDIEWQGLFCFPSPLSALAYGQPAMAMGPSSPYHLMDPLLQPRSTNLPVCSGRASS